MKRVLTWAVAAMLSIGIAGCGGEDEVIEPGVDGIDTPVTEPDVVEPVEPAEPNGFETDGAATEPAGQNGELPPAVEEEPATELPKQE